MVGGRRKGIRSGKRVRLRIEGTEARWRCRRMLRLRGIHLSSSHLRLQLLLLREVSLLLQIHHLLLLLLLSIGGIVVGIHEASFVHGLGLRTGTSSALYRHRK